MNASTLPAPPVSPWMTREEVADYLRVKPRTVDRMAREHKLTRFRMVHGDSPRFRRSEVVALVKIDDRVGERAPEQLQRAKEESLRARGHREPPGYSGGVAELGYEGDG